MTHFTFYLKDDRTRETTTMTETATATDNHIIIVSLERFYNT